MDQEADAAVSTGASGAAPEPGAGSFGPGARADSVRSTPLAPEAGAAARSAAPGRGGPAGAGVSDEVLLRAAQAGDADAFGRLYERYFDAVYGYLAFHLGTADEAEDVAGQVFVRALEALPRYRWTGVPFRAWLFRIAHNLVVDVRRRRARRPVAPLIDVYADDHPLADPAAWLAEKGAREALLAAVDGLTAAQRQVIVLKFGAGMSNAEVAVALGRTAGAVKALQHAALRSLQRRLAESRRP
jgi:RNA polymerase sigma-70 factor (ECF subfamily)